MSAFFLHLFLERNIYIYLLIFPSLVFFPFYIQENLATWYACGLKSWHKHFYILLNNFFFIENHSLFKL